MKNRVRLSAVLVIAALAIAPLSHAGTVTLTGEGTVHFTPDAVRFVLSTQTRGASASDARDAAGNRISAWEKAAGQVLGELRDYDDSQVTVNEFVEHDDQGRPTDKRYFQASQTVRFNLTDLDLLNRVISAAEDADLSYQLGETSYYPTHSDDLEDAALAAAIDDAKKRCAFIAKRLDTRCGEVDTLKVLDQGDYPRPMMAMDSRRESVSQVRDREIKAKVEATFELE